MTYFVKALIATSSFMTVTTVASAANGTMQVEFKYNKSTPIEETYANFETTAKQACVLDMRGSRNVSKFRKNKFLRKCPPKLVGLAVRKTGNEMLIALHKERRRNRTYETIIASNSTGQVPRVF